jgi:hypothetical protein
MPIKTTFTNAALETNYRIRAAEVSRITTLSIRQVQSMAATGRIPGAAKLGEIWTFRVDALQAWIKAQEQACQRSSRPIATGAVVRFGSASSITPEASIDEAFERLIRKRRVNLRATNG